MRVVDPKTLDVPTLEFMLEYLREERDCYVDKYGDLGDDGELVIHKEANEAWRDTMRSLIEWTENTVKLAKEVVECHKGTGLGELLSSEEGRRRLAQYSQIQTTAIEAFRARVEEAIIAEINDPRNAVESPQWRQGLRIARVILNREAENDAQP